MQRATESEICDRMNLGGGEQGVIKGLVSLPIRKGLQ